MKFKGSKKIVSLFLAVLMVVSSVPAFALNASAAVNTSTDVSVLETAMQNYEKKMQNLQDENVGIMTNMKAAYDAYVDAQKAIDAVKYGYSTSIDVASVAANLTNATNNMNSWTSYKGTMRSKFSTDANYVRDEDYANTYKNLLYADETATQTSVTQVEVFKNIFNNKIYCNGSFYYSNVVMLYDGKTAPQTGVMFNSYGSNTSGTLGKNVKEYAAWMSAGNGGLKLTLDRWKGTSDNGDYQWIMNSNRDDSIYASDNTSYVTSKHSSNIQHGNYITFDASNDPFTNDDLVKTYTPTWSFYTTVGDKDNRNKGQVSTSIQIQIFNYEAVLKAIDSTKSTIAKVANYKQGGLSTLFNDIESLMKDPNSFFTENGARKNGIDSCSSYYSGVITNTKRDLNSVTADDTRYKDLRTAIADAETAPTTKTADSLVAYGKAISEARNVFASDVISHGYNSPDNAATKANAITTAYNALVNADSDDAYSNFDAAVKVVEAMNQDALTADGKTAIANALSTQKAIVYKTLSGDDANAYYLATGQQPTGELKNTAKSETDPCTALLLNTAQNTEYIKKSTLTFAAQIDGVSVSEANKVQTDIPYGELVELSANAFADVKALNGNYSVRWTVSYEENGGSRKITSIDNTVLVRVTENMTVTALVTNENSKENNDQYIVKFYNLYNNLEDVTYVSKDKLPAEGTVKNTTISVGTVENYKPDVPFYNLTGFTVSAPDKYNVVKIRPLYDTIPNVIINVIKGNVKENNYVMAGSNEYAIDRPLYLETSVADFYAWAVKTTDGKYQIVSYDKDYVFKTYVNETYTPVVQISDTSYEVYTGNGDETEPLTADNIDQFNNNTDYNLSNNDYLYAKLKSKAPFVYIEKAQDINVDGVDKYRLYIRITAGSDSSLSSFGLKNGDKTFVVKERNNLTGQFSVTFKNKPADTSAVKAYASYKFNYNYAGVDYNIVATDLSSIPTV